MSRNTRLALIAGVVIVLVGVVVAQFASDQPDGLEYIAEQEGFADSAEDHDLSGGALADYGENLDGTSKMNTAVSALVGLLATAAIAGGLFWLARSGPKDPSPTS